MVFAPASKRTLSILAIVSLGFTLLGVFTGLIPPTSSAQAEASLLFALHAGKGWIVADKDSKTGYKLFLAEVEPNAIWFTDRPERESGTLLTARLVQEWSSFFAANDEPNAVIMASSVGDERDSVVEMLQPVYDPRVAGLIADVRFVGQDDTFLPPDDQPVEIGVTDVFIDDATVQLPASGSAPTDPNAPAPAPAPADSNAPGAAQQGTGQQGTGQQSTGQQSTGQQSTGQQSTGQQSTGQQSTGQTKPKFASPNPGLPNSLAQTLAVPNPMTPGLPAQPPLTPNPPVQVPPVQNKPAPIQQPLTTGAAAGANSQQGSGIVVPTDALDWTYHVIIPDPADDSRITKKSKLANTPLDESSLNNFVYSFPPSILVSNFSDHHLMIANESLGISLHASSFATGQGQ